MNFKILTVNREHYCVICSLIERNERLKRVNQALEVKAKKRDEFLALSQQTIH